MDSELMKDLVRMRRENIKASEVMNEAARTVISLKLELQMVRAALAEAREELERADSCSQEARAGK